MPKSLCPRETRDSKPRARRCKSSSSNIHRLCHRTARQERIDLCRRSRRPKSCDQKKSTRDPSDVCAGCVRNCKNQSTALTGNPFLTVLVRDSLSSIPRGKLIRRPAGNGIASRAEKRSVPTQNDFAKKHPGQCAECQI